MTCDHSKIESEKGRDEVPIDRSVHSVAEKGEAGTNRSEKALAFIPLGASHLAANPNSKIKATQLHTIKRQRTVPQHCREKQINEESEVKGGFIN